MQKQFILIFGPQGSGKSTQAKLLAHKLGYKHVSTGELLRSLRDKKDPNGLELSKYWTKGDLVPDQLIEDILFKVFEKDTSQGIILDGYPRNINQLNSFLSKAEIHNWYIDKAFYLIVGEKECVKRISKRVGIENRVDENEEAIKRRLNIYYKSTEPLIAEFEKMGVLERIDGEQTVEEVHRDLYNHFPNDSS